MQMESRFESSNFNCAHNEIAELQSVGLITCCNSTTTTFRNSPLQRTKIEFT